MALGPQTPMTVPVVRRFTRNAYDRYELLKRKLIRSGLHEVDIVLRLDHIVRAAAAARASPVAAEFFDYVMVCEVTRDAASVLVRIVTLEKP